jgi:hypothetical protein
VDYIAPQLYWPFGGEQDYGLLMPWWAGQVNDYARHLYVGHGAYKIDDWPEDEIPNQISLNRETNSSLGSIYFSYSDIRDNIKGSLDSLKNNYYKYFAVPPQMNWKDSLSAPAPKNVQSSLSGNDIILSWEAGNMTVAHDDAAHRYLVYKWPSSGSFNANDASQIAAIIPASETLSYSDSDHETYSFGIVAQDQLSNESALVMAESDHDLDLNFENDTDATNWGSHNEGSFGTSCTWNSTGGTLGSGALNFTDPGWTFLIKRPLTADSQSAYTLTFNVKTSAWTHSTNTLNAYVTGLSSSEPQTIVSTCSTYTPVSLSGIADAGTSGYIRFHGLNDGNPISLWIDNLSFTVETSGTPTPITLASFTAITKNGVIELSWETATETNNARFVIYRNNAAIGSVDGAGTTTEPHSYSFVDDNVVPGIVYTYVLADVDYANEETLYDGLAVTLTANDGLVAADFVVEAAYPNPFNPSTVISMHYAVGSNTVINIYNTQGVLVDQLINGFVEAGHHELTWDASGVPSGVYIVKMQAGEFVNSQKIVLIK